MESRGNVINLNDEQLAARNRLSEYTNVLTEFGGVMGAAFEEDDLKGYIDERLSDLSKSLDASDPLGQYDQFREELEEWNDKIDQAWEDKEAEGRTLQLKLPMKKSANYKLTLFKPEMMQKKEHNMQLN